MYIQDTFSAPKSDCLLLWAQRKQEMVSGREMEAIKTTDLHHSLLTPAIQCGSVQVMMKVVTQVYSAPPITVFSAL